jgi:hypothetical protein
MSNLVFASHHIVCAITKSARGGEAQHLTADCSLYRPPQGRNKHNVNFQLRSDLPACRHLRGRERMEERLGVRVRVRVRVRLGVRVRVRVCVVAMHQ